MRTHQTPPSGDRHGKTYDPARDRDRLNRQARDVWDVMIDGAYYTLRDIERATRHPQTSISARLRDFRKAEFGGHTVDRVRMESGAFRYRLRVNRKRT